jgi:hypothetical protein
MSDANGVDGLGTKSFDGMRRDGADGRKIRKEGGDMAGSSGIDYKREGGRRG